MTFALKERKISSDKIEKTDIRIIDTIKDKKLIPYSPEKKLYEKGKIRKADPIPISKEKRIFSKKIGAKVNYTISNKVEEESKKDIYLIHDCKDHKRFTDKLSKYLRNYRLKVWYDNIINHIGQHESMVMGVKLSKRIVIFISKNLLDKLRLEPNGSIGIELRIYNQKQIKDPKRILIPIWDDGIKHGDIYDNSKLCSTLDDDAIKRGFANKGCDGKTAKKIAQVVKDRYSKDTGWVSNISK